MARSHGITFRAEDANMKRMLLALAVVGLAGVGSVQADWGGFGPPAPQSGPPIQPVRNEFSAQNTLMGMGTGQPGKAPDRYGMLPGLRKAFRVGGAGCDSCHTGGGLFSKGGGGCANGNCGNGGNGGGYGGGGYGGYPQYPPMMQGTLVFPNHQYVRSPRDFFMYEPGK